MKCIIPGPNVKVFAKAIHAIAKIGDEMYLQPQRDGISFRSVNTSNSAYVEFTFQESFFSYYVYGDIEDEDAQKCKISMRSAIGVFKTPNVLDKQVENCHVKLNSGVDEVLFVLKYKNGISKTYLVPILDCGKLKVAYKKDNVPNNLSYHAKVLIDALQIFQQNLIEITVEVLPEKMILRNYTDEASGNSHVTRTQLALTIGEFENYKVSDQMALTFCLKELKALLGFAESAGTLLNMHFQSAGKPIVFVLKDTTFEANLVLATVNPETGSQTETTISGKKETCRKRNTSSRGNKRAVKTTRKAASAQSKSLNNSGLKNAHSSRNDIQDRSINGSVSIDQTNSSKETPNRDISKSRTKDQIRPNHQQADVGLESGSPLLSSTAVSTANSSLNRLSLNQSKIERNTAGTKRNDAVADDNDLLDCVPASPPPVLNKRAQLIFQRCFQKTFHPSMIPGYDEVLVEASDEES